MTPMLTLAILLYAVNAILFGFLAYVYGKTALSTRAKYPLGLFVFSILLLLHSAGTAVAYFFLGPYFGEEAIPYMSVMGSFELVGVLALLRITL
ncbi:MAG TPA: hypothetical protein VGR56_04700 [Nitrososphaerales archaeon]|nr:hypothetical protein [Nitrososphaerales archaeon]